MVEASSWQEDGCCGKEQGMNEIIGGGAWSSHTGEVLQQINFDNPVSLDDMVRFICKDSFYVNGFFVLV
ncbi:hypothetical protein TIFTF001_024682 [Ficus carica]|uniref:Uncharacterized protein n=1 Tax=Ficus carica TaxID=3494 RepID=A0AA88AW11_FICCA|nr:hypothetical protein TIFTF001_024682 [Ficus carica]